MTYYVPGLGWNGRWFSNMLRWPFFMSDTFRDGGSRSFRFGPLVFNFWIRKHGRSSHQ